MTRVTLTSTILLLLLRLERCRSNKLEECVLSHAESLPHFKAKESCSFDGLRALVTRHCQGPSFHKQGGPVVLDGVAPHPVQGKELADGGLGHSALGQQVYSTRSSG